MKILQNQHLLTTPPAVHQLLIINSNCYAIEVTLKSLKVCRNKFQWFHVADMFLFSKYGLYNFWKGHQRTFQPYLAFSPFQMKQNIFNRFLISYWALDEIDQVV